MAAVSLAVAGLAVAAVGTGVAINQANKADAANKRGQIASAAVARLENARERRSQVRQARIQRGTATSQGATSNSGGGGFGGIGSSSTQGQVAGVDSQLRSNMRFLDESTRLNSIASRESIRASTATTNAATASAVANAGFTAATLFGPGGQFAT